MGVEYRASSAGSGPKYLGFPEVNHSKGILRLFGQDPENHPVLRRDNTDLKQMAKLKDSYSRILEDALAQPGDLIISGEEIGTLPEMSKIHLVDFFKQKGFDVEVLLVVRNPTDLASSLIQQRIKGGKYGEQAFSINTLYARYSSVFGFSDDLKLSMFSYENLIAKHGSVVAGLAKKIGLDASMVEAGARMDWVNTGLSESATRIVYRLNRILAASPHTRLSPKQRHYLFDILRRHFPAETDPLQNTVLSSAISGQARAEVYELRELFGIDYTTTKLGPTDVSKVEDYLETWSHLPTSKLLGLIPTGDKGLDSALKLVAQSFL